MLNIFVVYICFLRFGQIFKTETKIVDERKKIQNGFLINKEDEKNTSGQNKWQCCVFWPKVDFFFLAQGVGPYDLFSFTQECQVYFFASK